MSIFEENTEEEDNRNMSEKINDWQAERKAKTEESDQIREPGYYWVKFEGVDYWQVALFKYSTWTFISMSGQWFDSAMTEIDENRIINPNT